MRQVTIDKYQTSVSTTSHNTIKHFGSNNRFISLSLVLRANHYAALPLHPTSLPSNQRRQPGCLKPWSSTSTMETTWRHRKRVHSRNTAENRDSVMEQCEFLEAKSGPRFARNKALPSTYLAKALSTAAYMAQFASHKETWKLPACYAEWGSREESCDTRNRKPNVEIGIWRLQEGVCGAHGQAWGAVGSGQSVRYHVRPSQTKCQTQGYKHTSRGGA